MNVRTLIGLVALMLAWCSSALADQVLDLNYSGASAASGVQYEFVAEGLKRTRLAAVPVRGWQVADRAYFGQAKVGDKWGLGFVFERGDTVYGVNHRGIEVRKRLF
ncbi:MAG: hypothetical protein ACFHX7_17255 [Pseudomonadota bacterium]